MLSINMIPRTLECLALCPVIFIALLFVTIWSCFSNIWKLTFTTCTYSCRQGEKEIFTDFQAWVNIGIPHLYSSGFMGCGILPLKELLSTLLSQCHPPVPFGCTSLPLAVTTGDSMWGPFCKGSIPVVDKISQVMTRWSDF